MSALEFTDPSESLLISRTDSARWRAFWIACMAICLPMFVPYLVGMWGFEHYRYFPFVFLVVAYLVHARWDGLFRSPRGWIGWGLVGTGGLATLMALAFSSATFAGLAFVLMATACLHSMSGESDRSLTAVAVPLLLLVQLPFNLDRLLVLRLQGATTQLASVFLDILGVPHAVLGNVLQLPSKELFVAEACSGIQSVFTLAFLSCLVVAWNRRHVWLTPLYLLIAVLLAVAGNTFRVTTIAVAEAWWGRDLATGWTHEMVGYLALLFAGLFLISFDQLITILLHPASSGSGVTVYNPILRLWNYLVASWRVSDEENGYGYGIDPELAGSKTSSPLDRIVLNRPAWLTLVSVAGLLTLMSLFQATRVDVNRNPQAIVRSSVLFEPEPDLPDQQYRVLEVGDHQFTRNGSEPRLGQNADVWDIGIGGEHRGQLVLSQTYSGWHELSVCYENLEWSLVDREVCDTAGLSWISVQPDEHQSFVTARFKRPDGYYGYLLFTAINEDGSIPEAPSSLGALGARFFSRLERHGVISQQDLAMLQLWVVTPGKMEIDLLEAAKADFVALREQIAKAMARKHQASSLASLPEARPAVSDRGQGKDG